MRPGRPRPGAQGPSGGVHQGDLEGVPDAPIAVVSKAAANGDGPGPGSPARRTSGPARPGTSPLPAAVAAPPEAVTVPLPPVVETTHPVRSSGKGRLTGGGGTTGGGGAGGARPRGGSAPAGGSDLGREPAQGRSPGRMPGNSAATRPVARRSPGPAGPTRGRPRPPDRPACPRSSRPRPPAPRPEPRRPNTYWSRREVVPVGSRARTRGRRHPGPVRMSAGSPRPRPPRRPVPRRKSPRTGRNIDTGSWSGRGTLPPGAAAVPRSGDHLGRQSRPVPAATAPPRNVSSYGKKLASCFPSVRGTPRPAARHPPRPGDNVGPAVPVHVPAATWTPRGTNPRRRRSRAGRQRAAVEDANPRAPPTPVPAMMSSARPRPRHRRQPGRPGERGLNAGNKARSDPSLPLTNPDQCGPPSPGATTTSWNWSRSTSPTATYTPPVNAGVTRSSRGSAAGRKRYRPFCRVRAGRPTRQPGPPGRPWRSGMWVAPPAETRRGDGKTSPEE